MEIEVGSVYRVDHSSNFPESLFPLNPTKSVLVNRKGNEEVTVVFPSSKSLDKFFGAEKLSGSMQPSMDQKFTMSLNLGKKILTRKVSFEEFAAQRSNRSFWVSTSHDHHDHDDDDGDRKSSSVEIGVKWETRRRTKFYTRRKIKPNLGDQQSGNAMKTCCEDEGVKTTTNNNNVGNEKVEKGEDIEEEEEPKEELGKRKCRSKGAAVYRDKKKKKIKKADTKPTSQKKFIDSQHRWTVDRYKQAEINMLKIMKQKGAVPKNPILRPDLRAEARKLIGDTGLLDHLLKHMAGKLAPGGKERFCRRHNPEGAMEYWMESADLVQLRKQAGVADPFWVPPPGWKPGDCPTQDPVCALQLKELREEVFSMKREIEKLALRRGHENREVLNVEQARTTGNNANERRNFEESLKPLKEMYQEVLQKKAKVEKQLMDISKSFSGMQEELARIEKTDISKAAAAAAEAMSGNAKRRTRVIGEAAEKDEEKGRGVKSGFRICKPEGSFLWPSSCSSSQSQFEDPLGYPTPTSGGTPSLFYLPSPHHPQPTPVSKPVATKAGITLFISTATIRGSPSIQSITSPSTDSSTPLFHHFVPDLNQLPLS